jgi:MFS family permease
MLSTSLVRTRDNPAEKRTEPVLTDIRAGLTYIGRTPVVVVLLLMGVLSALLAFPFRSLLPVFIVDVYGYESEALGLLVSAMGIGAIAGSLFVATLPKRRRGLILIVGVVFSSVALGLIALIPKYLLAAGFMVLLGVGDSIRRALNMALIMEIVEPAYRGRVISVYIMTYGLMPLGVVPTGVLAEFFGIRVAVGVLSILLLTLAAIMFLSRRGVRTLQ